jgi:hypothetical protein
MIRIRGCTTAIAALAIAVPLPMLAQAEGSSDSHKPKLVSFDAPGATKETSAALPSPLHYSPHSRDYLALDVSSNPGRTDVGVARRHVGKLWTIAVH